MTEERIDFTPLDPHGDPARYERRVAAIVESAGPELAARRAHSSVFSLLAEWRRPLLAAAAIAAIISGATLMTFRIPSASADAQSGVAEALGVPETIATWVRSDETPTTAELLLALEATQ